MGELVEYMVNRAVILNSLNVPAAPGAGGGAGGGEEDSAPASEAARERHRRESEALMDCHVAPTAFNRRRGSVTGGHGDWDAGSSRASGIGRAGGGGHPRAGRRSSMSGTADEWAGRGVEREGPARGLDRGRGAKIDRALGMAHTDPRQRAERSRRQAPAPDRALGMSHTDPRQRAERAHRRAPVV